MTEQEKLTEDLFIGLVSSVVALRKCRFFGADIMGGVAGGCGVGAFSTSHRKGVVSKAGWISESCFYRKCLPGWARTGDATSMGLNVVGPALHYTSRCIGIGVRAMAAYDFENRLDIASSLSSHAWECDAVYIQTRLFTATTPMLWAWLNQR